MLRKISFRTLMALAVCLLATPAWAEPAGAQTQAPATSGATELDGQGAFAQAAETENAPTDDATDLEVGAGGLLSSGNARSLSLTGTGNFRIRRSIHEFSAAFAGNYGRAAVTGLSMQDTVKNVQGRLRYDVFFHPYISFFTMITARNDVFQGLQARINVDPGFAFYIIKTPKHRLWTEAGYDFQYDRRTEAVRKERTADGELVRDALGNPINLYGKERLNHAARVAGNYVNQLNERMTFRTGLEFMQSFQVAKRWRLNWDSALNANLIKNLSLALTFTVRVDNDPVAVAIKKVDTITALQFVYRFF